MKSPWPSLSFILGFFAGIALGILLGYHTPHQRPDTHVHQFGFWTNAPAGFYRGVQERYCTNCGFYERGDHR